MRSSHSVEAQTVCKSRLYELKLASCRYNQDSPRTCQGMNETREIEKLAKASEPNIERTGDVENFPEKDEKEEEEEEDGRKAKDARKMTLLGSGDSSARKSTNTSLSSSDRRDFTETESPKLSNSNTGKFKETETFPQFSYYFSSEMILSATCGSLSPSHWTR